jgi:hypothetical protein
MGQQQSLLLYNIHVMFSGQNHAEKVDSAFGQWIYSGKPDFDSLRPISGAFGHLCA